MICHVGESRVLTTRSRRPIAADKKDLHKASTYCTDNIRKRVDVALLEILDSNLVPYV